MWNSFRAVRGGGAGGFVQFLYETVVKKDVYSKGGIGLTFSTYGREYKNIN
jgi:hypothetical protein